jgi:DNA-binding beta-propeller fold protein YncE
VVVVLVLLIGGGGSREIATIQVGAGPAGVAIGEGGVFVANSGAGTVVRIDPGSNKVSGRPAVVGETPEYLAVGEGSVWTTRGSEAGS